MLCYTSENVLFHQKFLLFKMSLGRAQGKLTCAAEGLICETTFLSLGLLEFIKACPIPSFSAELKPKCQDLFKIRRKAKLIYQGTLTLEKKEKHNQRKSDTLCKSMAIGRHLVNLRCRSERPAESLSSLKMMLWSSVGRKWHTLACLF